MRGIIITTLSFVICFVIFTCDRIEFEEGDIEFSVSQDTVYFDTVFTEIGSTTRSFKIYNSNDKFIRLDRIYFTDKDDFFRMNVNGQVGNDIRDVEIPPRDSIHIFIIATIDPDQDISSSPFIIDRNLIIEGRPNKTKSVLVSAWGQNANYFPDRYHGRKTSLLNCENGTLVFDDEKPFIIYGRVIVDSCLLQIAEGNKIYFHGGLVPDGDSFYRDGQLYFTGNSQLMIEGTKENPVIIQGDRLDFDLAFGLYHGLTLGPGSVGNEIRYAQISQGVVGIELDSAATLDISYTEIRSTGGPGISGRHCNINMTNCLVEGNGNFNALFIYGGDYDIRFCTFSNFGGEEELAFGFTNYYDSDLQDNSNPLQYNQLNLSVVNSLFITDYKNSLFFSDAEKSELMNYRIDHSMMTLAGDFTEKNEGFGENCTNCTFLKNDGEIPLFLDRSEGDYHLDTMSVAESKGLQLEDVTKDIEGFMRFPTPDIGAYESRIKGN